MIIIDDCFFIIDYYLLLLIIIIMVNKFSSSINEVIRPVINFLFFFFTIRFHKYKKALKRIKNI